MESHWMIDFKSIVRVECNAIERGKPPPTGMKFLQLSIRAREGLRQKLALYFARVPEEDQGVLGLGVG
jgi:hypothetical protein